MRTLIAVKKNWPKKREDEHAEYFAEVLGLFQKDTPHTGYIMIQTKDFIRPVPAFPLGDFYVVSSVQYYYIYEIYEVAVEC